MSGTNCAFDYERQSNHVGGTKTVLSINDRNSGRLTEGTATRRFAEDDDAVMIFVSHEKCPRKSFTAFGIVNKRKARTQISQIIIDMHQLTSENDISFYEETWDSNIKCIRGEIFYSTLRNFHWLKRT